MAFNQVCACAHFILGSMAGVWQVFKWVAEPLFHGSHKAQYVWGMLSSRVCLYYITLLASGGGVLLFSLLRASLLPFRWSYRDESALIDSSQDGFSESLICSSILRGEEFRIWIAGQLALYCLRWSSWRFSVLFKKTNNIHTYWCLSLKMSTLCM